MRNPYNWRTHTPQVMVRRPDVDPIVSSLLHGNGVVLLGGRGMGKSVLLRQVEADLESRPGIRVLRFAGPPPRLSVDACHAELADGLRVAPDAQLNGQRLLASCLDSGDGTQHLVLLYDEFEGYALQSPSGEAPGKRFFNDLETARREIGRIGILAAGNMGVFLFRDVLGSVFLSRAERRLAQPFVREEIARLAAEPVGHQRGLSEEVVDALLLASGGVPALVTYGLETLWGRAHPTARDVSDVFAGFQEQHREFLRDVEASFADARLSDVPRRVWELIEKGGSVPRGSIQDLCARASGALRLDVIDVLDLLRASGLIHVTGSIASDDPLRVHPVPSILSLRGEPSARDDFESRFREDLERLLAKLHASSADFFRPGRGTTTSTLVPESVFAAHLSLGLDLLGWQVAREAQNVAGRTDIMVRSPALTGLGIIETKIWNRNDTGVQRQVEDYWSSETTVAAVVMLTDGEVPDWPASYRARCLSSLQSPPVQMQFEHLPIRARFACQSRTPDGLLARVDHYLLRLPKR